MSEHPGFSLQKLTRRSSYQKRHYNPWLYIPNFDSFDSARSEHLMPPSSRRAEHQAQSCGAARWPWS